MRQTTKNPSPEKSFYTYVEWVDIIKKGSVRNFILTNCKKYLHTLSDCD